MNPELFLQISTGVIFAIGYISIAFEHKWGINKSGTAILTGALLWLTIAVVGSTNEHGISEAIIAEGGEILSIVVFLLSAMTIVEVLLHYRLFDWLQEKIIQRKVSQKLLFWSLGACTFVLSAILDNLTTTLVMLQLGSKIYKNKNNFLIFAASVIIAANAGGAWSPIGDVTTIMLWVSGKFEALQIITQGILPSIVAWIIPHALLARQIKFHEEAELAHKSFDIVNEEKVKPYWSIIFVGLFSFLLPVFFNVMGMPPFLGILMGVGFLWVLIDWQDRRKTFGLSNENNENHASHNHEKSRDDGKVMKLIQRTDIATLKFFIGILLAVSALSYVGTIEKLGVALFGEELNPARLAVGSVALGFGSAIVDNVPLVAVAIKMLGEGTHELIWVLLALAAGTGGSMLVIGSAAGVAAMGEVKDLSFGFYFRKAALPAFLGYIGGIVVWCIMFLPQLLAT